MKDNTSNSDHSGISLPSILYLLSYHMVLVVNVYVYILEERLLRGSLLPCHKRLKNSYKIFSMRLEAAKSEWYFCKNSLLMCKN